MLAGENFGARILPVTREAMVRALVVAPDERLRKASDTVEAVDADVLAVVGDMVETLRARGGYGISAVQIGVMLRVVVVNTKNMQRPFLAMINPEILWRSAEKEKQNEGCFSVPGPARAIRRPAVLKVRFLDVHGAEHVAMANGLMACVVQHEVDHLDGVLITDRSKGLN